MRLLSSRLLAGLCLTAASLSVGCTLSRPEGAFTPEYPEEGSPLDNFDEPDDQGDGDAVGDGDGPDVFDDAGTAEPTNDKYKDVVGTYLARFDEHSSTVSQLGPPVGAISSNSRTSRFFLIRITEDEDGKLISTEQMCAQSNESTCQKNCATSTKIFDAAAAMIPKSQKIVRELMLNEETGFFTALGAATYLGYTPTEGDRGLPISLDDPRIWNKDSAGREALYTELKITVEVLGAPSSVVCQVNMVQELNIAWNAKGTGREGVFSLDGAKGVFTSGDTKSDILGAKADPTDKREDCMGKGDTDGDTEVDRGIVAFKRTDLTKCPTLSRFESEIPPDAPP